MWFNPRCSKCVAAKAAFDDAGLTYHLRYYLEEPPTTEELRAVLDRLGLEPWEICRTADADKAGADLPADRDAAHRDEWIELMVAHPALVQRPLVVADDGTAYVARDTEMVDAAIAHSRSAGEGGSD
jgi:arsenate reductase (glutaredoxin)